MVPLEISAEDGYKLSGHLFTPGVSSDRLVVINSATGVKQQIYFSVAKYLQSKGFYVVTYDYRGIGLSKPKELKNFVASMQDWGRKDYHAVLSFIKKELPSKRLIGLGHSVGALILGMSPLSKEMEKWVFVGTQKAYVGNLNLKTKILGYLGFGIVQPVSTKLLGYFPAKGLGLGENLPKGSSKDWKTLVLHRKSTNALMTPEELAFASELDQEVLVLRAEDDSWLSQSGVDLLLEETYPNLRPTKRLLRASESEKGEIGHVNYFRSYNKKLWGEIADFLND